MKILKLVFQVVLFDKMIYQIICFDYKTHLKKYSACTIDVVFLNNCFADVNPEIGVLILVSLGDGFVSDSDLVCHNIITNKALARRRV